MEDRIKVITTNRAASPGGHYVQATEFQGLIHISGQLPVRANGTHTFGESFEVQARQSLHNLLEILSEAGGGPSHLLKVTVYLAGIENWTAFNQIYSEILGSARPARSIVPVPELHYGYLIEIDAVAMIAKKPE